MRCFLVSAQTWGLITNSLMAMEDLMAKFASRLAITEEEHKLIVVDQLEVATLKSSSFFLMGRVLSHKSVNKERFK